MRPLQVLCKEEGGIRCTILLSPGLLLRDSRQQEEQVEDDPTIDEVRHIPPKQYQPVYFNLPAQEERESEAVTSTDTSDIDGSIGPEPLNEWHEGSVEEQTEGESGPEEVGALGVVPQSGFHGPPIGLWMVL